MKVILNQIIILSSVGLCNVMLVDSRSTGTDYIRETKVTNDLRFVVPLSNGQKLCYNMRGLDNLTFNLISHPLININALLVIPENESSLITDATIMTDIGIMVQPDHCMGECKPEDITRMIISASDRSFALYGSRTVITDRLVYVLLDNSTASINLGQVIKNKQSPSLIIAVKKPRMSLRINFVNEHLDMVIIDDRGLGSDCHGIIGQFLHKEAHINNEVIKINGKVTEIEEKPMWDTDIPCVHIKPHYGNQAEGILEGQFTDYAMDNLFSPDFFYSNFKMNQCELLTLA